MKILVTAFLSLAIFSTISCKKAEEAINKSANHGSMTAKINGSAYSAPTVTGGLAGNTLFVKGHRFGNYEEVSFTVSNYSESKTNYVIDKLYISASYVTSGGSNQAAETGEINIEKTGSNSVKGTFFFETEEGTKITDGKFDLEW